MAKLKRITKFLLAGFVWAWAATGIAMADTAIRFESDRFFNTGGAILNNDGLEYLEEYFKSQDCETYTINLIDIQGHRDTLLRQRVLVVEEVARRMLGLDIELINTQEVSDNPTQGQGRPIEIYPSECGVVVAKGTGGGRLAALGGLLAVLIIAGISGSGSTSNTQ